MKRSILIISLVLLSMNALTQKGEFGMGIILGNPTALSVKYWTGELTALDASLGYRYSNANHLYLNTDFLFHLWDFQKEEGTIRVYFGAGAGLGFISDLSIGLRMPVGASLFLDNIPLELFAELVPGIQLFGEGDVRFMMEGYIGAHWYF